LMPARLIRGFPKNSRVLFSTLYGGFARPTD
jgi:hypothetical protein